MWCDTAHTAHDHPRGNSHCHHLLQGEEASYNVYTCIFSGGLLQGHPINTHNFFQAQTWQDILNIERDIFCDNHPHNGVGWSCSQWKKLPQGAGSLSITKIKHRGWLRIACDLQHPVYDCLPPKVSSMPHRRGFHLHCRTASAAAIHPGNR